MPGHMSPISSRLRSTAIITHSATTPTASIQSTRTSAASISPSTSSASHDWTQQGGSGSHHGRTSRPRRFPSRPLLRTAFRNFTGTATIVVGPKQCKYLVHKELLTSASPFFAAALNGTFAEGLDQCVHLPEEKPEIFEWFLQWLYTGTLTTQPIPSEPQFSRYRTSTSQSHHHHHHQEAHHLDGDLRNSAGSPKYFLLLEIYALSDRLLTVPLSNHVLSTIARLSEQTNSVPTPSDTWILYDSAILRDSSPARALVLDLFAYKKTDKLLETHPDDWHPKFLRDLVVKLKRPGPDALERHSLVAWRPRGDGTTTITQWRACDHCREVIRPDVMNSDRCCLCDKFFCGECLRKHTFDAGFQWHHDPTGCKPWNGMGMCLRYHEHAHGEACG